MFAVVISANEKSLYSGVPKLLVSETFFGKYVCKYLMSETNFVRMLKFASQWIWLVIKFQNDLHRAMQKSQSALSQQLMILSATLLCLVFTR